MKNMPKNRIIAAIILIVLAVGLLADYAYETNTGGTFVTHNNGDGTWNYCYYTGASTFLETPERWDSGLTTSQMHDLFGDFYGCEPGTGRVVPDNTGTWPRPGEEDDPQDAENT